MDKSLILSKIIELKKFKSDAEFARFLGIPPQNLSKWKARKTYDTELLYTKCPELNPEWLLTGEGSMLKEEEVKKAAQQYLPAANNELVDLLREKAAILEGQIKDKEEKEAMYKEKIMALENELQKYKNLSQPSRAVASGTTQYSTARV